MKKRIYFLKLIEFNNFDKLDNVLKSGNVPSLGDFIFKEKNDQENIFFFLTEEEHYFLSMNGLKNTIFEPTKDIEIEDNPNIFCEIKKNNKELGLSFSCITKHKVITI